MDDELTLEEQKWRKVLEEDPENLEAWANIGKILSEKKEYHQAEQAYQKALEISPEDNWILFNLAFLYNGQNKFAEAADCFKKLVESNPENEDFIYNLAILLERMEEWEKAKEYYEKAMIISPQDHQILTNLGFVYWKLQQSEEAIELYKEAIEANPQFPKSYYFLGKIYEEEEKIEEALAVYREAFKENPLSFVFLAKIYSLTDNKRYIPSVASAIERQDHQFANYYSRLISNIASFGDIVYDLMLVLYEKNNNEPIYYVTLEQNALHEELGGPSHFLCAFDENGHSNFGGFEQEVTLENFKKKAFEIIKKRFDIEVEATE